MFELHPQLKKDTVTVGQFELSMVLLSRDANYPWAILVPKRANMREIHHLAEADQIQLIRESSHLSEVMTSLFAPTTMNIAALGNSVPQLHIHHVVRYDGDPAWPGAIWGAGPAKAYDDNVLNDRLKRMHASLVGQGFTAHCGVDESGSEGEMYTP